MVILLGRSLPERLRAEIDAIVPGARVVSEADLAADPCLIGRIEVCCARLPSGLWGMLLSLVRNLPRARDLQRMRRWDHAACVEVLSILQGKTLCVAGLGEIGSRCARIGRAFGMRVVGIRRDPSPHPDATGEPLEGVVDKEAGY